MKKIFLIALFSIVLQSFSGRKPNEIFAETKFHLFFEKIEDEFEWPDDRWKTENGRKSVIWFAILELDKYFRIQGEARSGEPFSGMMGNFTRFENTRAMKYGATNNHSLINIYQAKRVFHLLDDYIISSETLSCDSGADACVIVQSEKKYWCRVSQKQNSSLPDYLSRAPARSARVTYKEYLELKKKVDDPYSPITKVELVYDSNGNLRVNEFVSANISLNSKVFVRGFYNMDANGIILWNDDWTNDASKNIYYRYATDLEEAIEFVLLHEYAHAIGLRENVAEAFAINMIIKLRIAKKNNTVVYIDFYNDFGIQFENWVNSTNETATFSIYHHGGSPKKNLPPGCRRR